jgi:hypothetical protein
MGERHVICHWCKGGSIIGGYELKKNDKSVTVPV